MHTLQIRAVAHAFERVSHHLQKVPEVALSIRQLQDWCGKQAPFWSDQATAAGAALSSSAAAAAAGGSGASASAGGGPQGGVRTSVAGGPPADDGVTLSLSQVMALGASQGASR